MKTFIRECVRTTLVIAPLASLLITIAGIALRVMFGHQLLLYIGIASAFVVVFMMSMSPFFPMTCTDTNAGYVAKMSYLL